MATKSDTETLIKIRTDITEPSMYKVIYLNDDVTTLEFVIGSLIDHFEYDEQNAYDITVNIHEQGSAVVATLPYEIAEQKGVEITLDARQHGYPLQVKLEAAS